ncbi:MAG TPA: ComF family protein [Methylomirabilota bacterium]|nr:ComF family protein [Methylomirabilota bacterium]
MGLNVSKMLKPWADAALGFFYPDVCQLCHAERATRDQGYVGARCRSQVRVIEPPFCDRCGLPFEGEIDSRFECTNCREMELHFSAARSAVAARAPVLEAIHHYKYDGQMWFEEFLAELLIDGALQWCQDDSCDVLVPVPLYPVKEREREFNQAERLARRLGAALNVPVDSRLLKRIIPTPTQTRLSRKQRADNMRSAFALRRPQKLAGKSVVLIDDVFTTGATTSACAKVLLKAGAENVSVWTVARAEYRG